MVRELGEEEGMIRGREGVERVQGEGACRGRESSTWVLLTRRQLNFK